MRREEITRDRERARGLHGAQRKNHGVYADPSTLVVISAARDGSGPADVRVALSGYLVAVPSRVSVTPFKLGGERLLRVVSPTGS